MKRIKKAKAEKAQAERAIGGSVLSSRGARATIMAASPERNVWFAVTTNAKTAKSLLVLRRPHPHSLSRETIYRQSRLLEAATLAVTILLVDRVGADIKEIRGHSGRRREFETEHKHQKKKTTSAEVWKYSSCQKIVNALDYLL
jgi:hypothetical protein